MMILGREGLTTNIEDCKQYVRSISHGLYDLGSSEYCDYLEKVVRGLPKYIDLDARQEFQQEVEEWKPHFEELIRTLEITNSSIWNRRLEICRSKQ